MMRVASGEGVGVEVESTSVAIEDSDVLDGEDETQCTRSIEGKKWVRKDCKEARVEEARVGLPPGRFCELARVRKRSRILKKLYSP